VGDQIGAAVSGTLHYVGKSEFDRVRSLDLPAVRKTAIFAALARINALYMIARAGSGHIGSSFSSMEVMAWIGLNELERHGSESPNLFFSSKGHDAPGLYSVMLGLGQLDYELIHRLRKLGGLPGHPDVRTPAVVANTGSLGMGISKAKGIAFADRQMGRHRFVFVLTGDGELQEGQIWESLSSAANHRMGELIVVVDHNKLQSDTLVAKVSDLGDLEAKFAAFGWHVQRCDGNDVAAVAAAITEARQETQRPSVIIADTVKGKGVSFMEHTSIDSDVELYKFHSGAPSAEAYVQAAQELIVQANALLRSAGAEPLTLESVERPPAPAAGQAQRLIPAYGDALRAQARADSRIVALDADLILDTGLIPFQEEFPDRFVECGIAEQDMVSQAGGMALNGLLPVVHSFACFLSTRPNEQIYNNATEGTQIIYVASLAGLLPAGPGHSHQAIRDIAALGGTPNLIMMEPSCEAEVPMLFDWAVKAHRGPSYLRLVSIPTAPVFELPQDYRPQVGQGVTLLPGKDVLMIAYGPVMLGEAMRAAKQLRDHTGLAVELVNLPWLNRVDQDWLLATAQGRRLIVSIDNHYVEGGQGDRLAVALAAAGAPAPLLRLAIGEMPACGTNDEVLRHHRLDAESIAERVQAALAPAPVPAYA
jgi:transketolase